MSFFVHLFSDICLSVCPSIHLTVSFCLSVHFSLFIIFLENIWANFNKAQKAFLRKLFKILSRNLIQYVIYDTYASILNCRFIQTNTVDPKEGLKIVELFKWCPPPTPPKLVSGSLEQIKYQIYSDQWIRCEQILNILAQKCYASICNIITYVY